MQHNIQHLIFFFFLKKKVYPGECNPDIKFRYRSIAKPILLFLHPGFYMPHPFAHFRLFLTPSRIRETVPFSICVTSQVIIHEVSIQISTVDHKLLSKSTYFHNDCRE